MIRYNISPSELNHRITARKSDWQARADLRTAAFRIAKAYNKDESPIWSEIKQVFIDLQKGKCAFCERPLESKKEYDIEHFRPKNCVKPWKVPPELMRGGVRVNQTSAKEKGYYLLPYNVLNYSVACAKCNSELKSDCFPIRGTRNSTGEHPSRMQKGEKAWLIFPLGDFDDDPENLIAFHGLSPQALGTPKTIKHKRALVTIAFFKLDDPDQRRKIFLGRADVIQKMGLAFREGSRADTPANRKMQCQKIIDFHQSSTAPYSNCGRSYARLWRNDRATAEKLWDDAVDFLATVSPP
jgi:hypothetical protein